MIFNLPKEIIFPPVELAEPNGILAVGGDLSVERLIAAYRQGIFPWFSEGSPILWWSPDPRFILYPGEVKISKSMRQLLRRSVFSITYDQAFGDVIRGCRSRRKAQDGTWITDDMEDAYIELHGLGCAHSVEVWHKGALAGGLYGVSIGRMFFGESMFTYVSNASKAALITLCVKLQSLGFDCIDCQVYTKHLSSMGGRSISRDAFMSLISSSLKHKTIQGNWGAIEKFSAALN
ncbi:MAG: leucyl/phenylalanyl-tRNA--protein transferase [Spirochaetia bacterium]|jgi:leucyl/phenylalanyl-tRNA--protein transferase|nr:leucyl/phenylalanyl-tRNA--protein transferase [Spirochaetia bacterium]